MLETVPWARYTSFSLFFSLTFPTNLCLGDNTLMVVCLSRYFHACSLNCDLLPYLFLKCSHYRKNRLCTYFCLWYLPVSFRKRSKISLKRYLRKVLEEALKNKVSEITFLNLPQECFFCLRLGTHLEHVL